MTVYPSLAMRRVRMADTRLVAFSATLDKALVLLRGTSAIGSFRVKEA